MVKVNDYDATLQKFFAESIWYLEKLKKKTKDKKAAYNITAAIDMIQRIAANPAKFAGDNMRRKEGIDDNILAEAFIPVGTDDNNMSLSFFAVLNSMGDLKSSLGQKREVAQNKLLKSRRQLNYKLSSSMFKDVKYKFLSPEYFAIKKEQYQI